MRHIRLKFSLILILFSSGLFGQIDLRFDYELSDLKDIVKGEILLMTPEGNSVQLYFDTISKFHYFKKAFFTALGNYKLDFRYLTSKYKDSLVYNFELQGNETEIEIHIHLRQYIDSKWINGKWTEINRKNEGYVSIVKYFMPPKSIKLQVTDIKSGEDYKGPFFLLNNFSKDTIYGEYLPGYFWGSLVFLKNDSTRSRELIGQIDLNFVDIEPLYPDSSRIATVGSFGLFNKLPPNNYEYKLLFSKNGNAHGYSKYINTSLTQWWIKTETFYRLIYDFEIR